MSEFGVLNKIISGKINADILISGSSRSFKGINPEVIEKKTGLSCYNISTDGTGLEIQVPKLKMYLNYNKPPKFLIQDVGILGENVSDKIYEPYKYLPYIKDDSLFKGLEKVDENFWMHKYIPVLNLQYFNFDFYLVLFLDLKNSIQGKDKYIKGFFPDNSKWATNIEQLKINKPQGINVSIPKEYIIYLDELIRVCYAYKIKLILLSLPIYYKIYEIVNKQIDINDYFVNKSRENNIYYFNYSSSEMFRSTEYFYNFSHLNSDGANKFSGILGERLKQLYK